MLKAAVIGTGMIANCAHIPAYKYFSKHFSLAAVCDINEEKARECAKRHSIPAYFTSPSEMFEITKPDIVSVGTPNMYHKEYIKDALEAGIHVICEKPLALTYADAKELFELAQSKNIMLCAAQSMRFTPDRLASKALSDAGFFGDIYYGEFSRIRRRGIPEWGAFHIKEISGGGAFVDIGVHMLDALIWLMGSTDIVSVCGSTQTRIACQSGRAPSDMKASGALTGETFSAADFNNDDFNVEDLASGSILFEGGKRVNFKVAWAANLPDETSIILAGDRAGIRLPEYDIYADAPLSGKEFSPDDFNDARFSSFQFPGHFRLFENIAEHLFEGKELIIKPRETIAVSALIEMFYLSAGKEREVFFDEIK